MTDWIECGLPWADYSEPPGTTPFPDTSKEERAKWGTTIKELELTDEESDRLFVKVTNEVSHEFTRYSNRRRALRRAAAKAGLSEVLERLLLKEKIETWTGSLPKVKAWHQEYEARRAEQRAKTFSGQCLHVPGTLVEVEGVAYLIGNINTNRGVCNDCTAFNSNAIVTRYKKVWSPGSFEPQLE